MNADTEKLRELIAKATPGPWQAMNAYQWDSIIGDIDGPDDGEMHYESVTDITSHHDRSRANAALIAAAISALPALLDELARLRRLLREAVGPAGGDFCMNRALEAEIDAALSTSGATEE